jgi:hypothetical protein
MPQGSDLPAITSPPSEANLSSYTSPYAASPEASPAAPGCCPAAPSAPAAPPGGLLYTRHSGTLGSDCAARRAARCLALQHQHQQHAGSTQGPPSHNRLHRRLDGRCECCSCQAEECLNNPCQWQPAAELDGLDNNVSNKQRPSTPYPGSE